MTKSTLRAFTVACSIVGVSAAQRSEAQATFTSGSNNLSAGTYGFIPQQIQDLSQSIWNRDIARVDLSSSVTSATAVYSLVATSRQQVLLTGDQTTNQFTSVQVINTIDAFGENELRHNFLNQHVYAKTSLDLSFSLSELQQSADLWFNSLNTALGGLSRYTVWLNYSPSGYPYDSLIGFTLSNYQQAPVADGVYRRLNLQRGNYRLSIWGEAWAPRSLEPGVAQSNLNFDFRLNIPGPSTAALVLGPMMVMARRRR